MKLLFEYKSDGEGEIFMVIYYYGNHILHVKIESTFRFFIPSFPVP